MIEKMVIKKHSLGLITNNYSSTHAVPTITKRVILVLIFMFFMQLELEIKMF